MWHALPQLQEKLSFAKACHNKLTPVSQHDKSVLSASVDVLSVAKMTSNTQHVTSTDPGSTITVNIITSNGSVSTQASRIQEQTFQQLVKPST